MSHTRTILISFLHALEFKRQFTILCILFSLIYCPAYAQRVSDPDSTNAPINGHFYYENLGQIIDDTGALRPDIKYYTEKATPSLYFTENSVSFAAWQVGDSAASTLDTTYRIDMQFACGGPEIFEPCGPIETYEPSSDYLNYYLPHCSTGITDVPGYAGIVYRNAFNNIDYHFFSNDMGLVNYIDFKPGCNPADFMIRFTGQDSIVATASLLEIYLGSNGMAFPAAIAYQVDAIGNITPLPWLPTWIDNGGGIVTLSLGAYNPAEHLVIKISRPNLKTTANNGNLDWCTFYGKSGAESSPIVRSNSNNDLYHLMAQSGSNFPSQRGSYPNIQLNNGGLMDCFVSKFNQNEVRQWATYFGGSEVEIPLSMVESTLTPGSNVADLFISGLTRSTDLPLGTTSPTFQKTTYGGGSNKTDGFIASLDKSNGKLFYSTYFGGNDFDDIRSLDIDNTNGYLYFCGATISGLNDATSNNPAAGDFPLRRNNSNQFYQGAKSNGRDGFVGRIKLSDGSLNWSTYFGGEWDDYFERILHVSISGSDEIYVVGTTRSGTHSGPFTSPTSAPLVSGKLPLCDPTGSSGSLDYFQTTTNNVKVIGGVPTQDQYDGLITHFNSSQKLDWCTFYGGNGEERLTDVAINSNGYIYVVGNSSSDPETTNSQLPNTAGKLPYTFSGAAYHQGPGKVDAITGLNVGRDDIIAEFSPQHLLSWATYYGGSGIENYSNISSLPVLSQLIQACIVVDNTNSIFLASTTLLDDPAITTYNDDVPVLVVPGRYNGIRNNSSGHPNPIYSSSHKDGYIVQFGSNKSLKWAAHFGNPLFTNFSGNDPNNEETIASIAVGGTSNVTLYISGFTKNVNTPNQALSITGAFNEANYGTGGDVFIGRFINANKTAVESTAQTSKGLLSAFPNPSSNGRFYIEFLNSTNVSKASITVNNNMGQMLHQFNVKVNPGKNNYQIDLEALPPGIYFLQLTTDDYSEGVKLNKY